MPKSSAMLKYTGRDGAANASPDPNQRTVEVRVASMALPDREQLRNLLDYDPETGLLTWKARTPDMFKPGNTSSAGNCRTWNSKFAGKPAFTCPQTTGHLGGAINGKTARTHRVVWKWVTDEDPAEIDHINGDRTDNRWANLRAVTRTGNARNCARRSDNTTGAAGVFKCSHTPLFRARITVNKRNIALGYFKTFEEAKEARDRAKEQYGFTQRHGC